MIINCHCETLWLIGHRNTMEELDKLWPILIERGGLNIPYTMRTLWHSSRTKVVTSVVPPGEYCHVGIQNSILNYTGLEDIHEIKIDIGIDGMSVYKSSKFCLWPILGALTNRRDLQPFIIGVFGGKKSPHNIDEFM